eukprot:TRINITY_DN9474_c0_g1_i1.p1 TRINITY_DN9474_c0_g1~~TRINITY_DN9474_c0_g1_i1.p1  ORF type:complete len:104 (+),score=18.60 TRINITY_DN9474_c0_g1_i1:106-417(+)
MNLLVLGVLVLASLWYFGFVPLYVYDELDSSRPSQLFWIVLLAGIALFVWALFSFIDHNKDESRGAVYYGGSSSRSSNGNTNKSGGYRTKDYKFTGGQFKYKG